LRRRGRTEGKVGGQAERGFVVRHVARPNGAVNSIADNLTDQVRNIRAWVTTAVATGDLRKKITVDAQGARS